MEFQSWCILASVLIAAVCVSEIHAKLLTSCLRDANVVPEVIDNMPLLLIRVQLLLLKFEFVTILYLFPNQIVYPLRSVHLNCGYELTPRLAKPKPLLSWLYYKNKFYTMIMIGIRFIK